MYGKIFEEIFDGSLASEGGAMAIYTFMSMIVLADADGIVKYSVDALGKRMGLNHGTGAFLEWEQFRESIKLLEKEDPGSNLPAENGRRIIPLREISEGTENRGWWIVNYEYYKAKASKLEQKEKTRERVQRFRERQKKKSNDDVTPGNAKKRKRNGSKGHIDKDIDKDITSKSSSTELVNGEKVCIKCNIPFRALHKEHTLCLDCFKKSKATPLSTLPKCPNPNCHITSPSQRISLEHKGCNYCKPEEVD